MDWRPAVAGAVDANRSPVVGIDFPPIPHQRRKVAYLKMTKGRMEAFSDGVFAVIITIMVLELKSPKEQISRP